MECLTGGRRCIKSMAISALLVMSIGPGLAKSAEPSATVEIEQIQIAFIGSGNLGGGKLHYNGKTYSFKVGGLGIGGYGASKITATGEVYGLESLDQFPGAYVQGRAGFAAADKSKGGMWMSNTHGVQIRLDADRKGLALALGADAVYIKLK